MLPTGAFWLSWLLKSTCILLHLMNAREAEAGGSLHVSGQPVLQSQTLSPEVKLALHSCFFCPPARHRAAGIITPPSVALD